MALIDKKNNIKSIITGTRKSVERAIRVVKGAMNNQIGTILEHPEKVEKAVRTTEENGRSKAYIRNMKLYAKISEFEIFRENNILMIRDRIVIQLADRIKSIRNFMVIWDVSADGEKLVKPILTRESVIVHNNLTIEIRKEEYNKCKDV